ncbi:MAG: DUF4145 domain-containing protein [Clostridia bacterium]|nr:DUF4145 domain-containing protein [Clostridia bacterium]
MSLWKKLKEVLGKEEKPAAAKPTGKPALLPPLPKMPEKKAGPKEAMPKKPAPAKKPPETKKPAPAKKPAETKKPAQAGSSKDQTQAYMKMRAEHTKLKQLIAEKNMPEAVKQARQVVSLCLNLEMMRENRTPGNQRHLQKLAELKNVIPEEYSRVYEKTIIMLSPENEKDFDGRKGAELIRNLGKIINYEKSKIFQKGTKTGPKKQGQKKTGKQTPKVQPKTPEVNLSFKAKEKTSKAEPENFEKKNRELMQSLKTAKTYLQQKKAKESLAHMRDALESIAHALCKKYGVREVVNMTLENRIDALRAPVLLSSGQANIFHQARQITNRGAHFSDTPPSVSDAEKAYDLTQKVLEMYRIILQSEQKSFANVPLGGPEYYSPNRRFYGRWYDCNTRQALSMNTEFMRLREKAEDGDIQAMLDIAVGFLPANIPWTGVSLVMHPDNARFRDPYDARYYYWITRACDAAYASWKRGKDLPLPYLATALLEGLKFYVYYEYHTRHPGDYATQPENQYHKVINYMFGKFWGRKEDFADMLIAMMEEYKGQNIICPIHAEQTVDHVKFLMYLSCVQHKACRWYDGRSRTSTCRLQQGSFDRVPEKYAIVPEDKGKIVYTAIEKYHDFVYDMHHAYCNQINQRYLEAYRRSIGK